MDEGIAAGCRRAAAIATTRRDVDRGCAPRVVANGEGWLAEQIIARARAAGVPIHESRELVSLLLKEGILVSVYDERGAALLTALLSVDPEHEQIIVDAAPDPEQQRRLLASRHLRFVAFVHGVKVQFGAERIDAALYDGRQALRLRLPQRLIRMQRRDYFRVRPLATRPATCTVHDEHGAVVAVWRVIDVGGGGLAFACDRETSPYAPGTEVRDCTIDLPGEGTIVTGLRVRSAEPLRRGGGLRIGCEFTFMAPQARQAVQRYINRVEAEQRKSAAS